MFDFIYDFSSSDYESISEGELEHFDEYNELNEQHLLQRMEGLGMSPTAPKKRGSDNNFNLDDQERASIIGSTKAGNVDRDFHLRRLLDTYKKFEKRKRLRTEPYFQQTKASMKIKPN